MDIEYHDKSLTEKDICDLMSESEKRSLALAVFLSKIENEQNSKEMMVVLDDPVVSFDVNRIDKSIDVFKELSTKFAQVIIMTHYPMLIEDIANKTNRNHEISYLEVKRKNKYSVIKLADLEVFTNSKLNNQLVRLLSFCNEEHSENISNECRTFIQKFLETRYQKSIREKKLNLNVDFKDFIDSLASNKIITHKAKSKINLYRENLNSSSHDFTDPAKIQSSRSYIAEILDYIYNL